MSQSTSSADRPSIAGGQRKPKPKLDDATAAKVSAISEYEVHAQAWARWMGPVLPVVSPEWPVAQERDRGKRPHPELVPDGTSGATRDPAKIHEWWTRCPDANVGGTCDGLIVLDLDSYKDGHEDELAWLGELPPTREHRGRGRHLFYRDRTGLAPGEIRGKLGSTIDVKHGPAQYVVLPPSRHASGTRYRVWSARPIAPTTAGIRDVLRKPSPASELAAVPEAGELPQQLPEAVRKALERPWTDRSDHTWHVACAGGRAWPGHPELVVALLELDKVTQERWNEKPGLRERELPQILSAAMSARVPEKKKPCPVLPDEFWNRASHPFLAHVRQAALSVECVPDSVLHATFADVATLTHFDWYLPGKRRGTLDLLLCVVAESGDGKGTSMDAADGLTDFQRYHDETRIRVRALGSGEGMAQCYFDLESVPNDSGKGTHKEVVRTAVAVKFQSDEGSTYAELARRSGQTTGQLLRCAWCGEMLGGTYVGASKGCQLHPRCYRAVVILGLQVEACKAVLDEYPLGTPQRALWSTPVHPSLPHPDSQPPWPGPLDWKPDVEKIHSDPGRMRWHGTEIKVHPQVMREVRLASWERRTGRRERTKYDGHRELLCLKVAAILGYLRTGKRPVVNLDDWAAALQVVETSDAVRGWVEDQLGDTEARRRDGVISFAAEKAGAVRQAELVTEEKMADAAAERVRNVLLAAHKKHPEKTRRELMAAAGSRNYQIAKLVLPDLIAEGLVSWPSTRSDGGGAHDAHDA